MRLILASKSDMLATDIRFEPICGSIGSLSIFAKGGGHRMIDPCLAWPCLIGLNLRAFGGNGRVGWGIVKLTVISVAVKLEASTLKEPSLRRSY
jgi:hypothetical protein